jgi:hypothetical protein
MSEDRQLPINVKTQFGVVDEQNEYAAYMSAERRHGVIWISDLSVSPKYGEIYKERYRGDELRGIFTFSLYGGRGSQYNRVYKYLGNTKGFGANEIAEEDYQRALAWMKESGLPMRRGRLCIVSRYNNHNRDKAIPMKHGQQRGVYYCPCDGKSVAEIVEQWYQRWGLPRYERKKNERPPYTTGLEG